MADDSIYIDELVAIAEELSSVAAEAKSDSIKPAVDALTAAAEDVGKAWSRSNIGYHARVYYKDYAAPPTSEMFSKEWGLMFANDERGWQIMSDDVVRSEILARAGNIGAPNP
jgi:hypothetical protein